jgi:hypothetical protein
MLKALVTFGLLLGLASPAPALGERVTVTFEFPDRDPVRVPLTYDETVELINDKLNYKIDFWVYGALKKANLASVEDRQDGHVTLTSIGGVANGPAGRWVYYVNGIRSPYHINTQLAIGVRTIRYVFLKN